MTIFFILSAIETFALGVYLISVGSQGASSAYLNLSLSRLVLSAATFMLAVAFLIFAVVALRKSRKGTGFLTLFLADKKKIFSAFLVSLLLALSMGYLLTRPPEFGGDYRLVIERLEPFFAWLLFLSAQAGCFLLVWFCDYFIVNKERSIVDTKRELLPVFAIFFISIITKWLFVSSAAYGPGVGDEMKYYDMADSLNRGFFSIAQTHVAPPLYPLTFLPALVFGKYTFDLIKLINMIVSSAIVFPIYLLSRSFLDEKKSLVPVIIACLNPFHLVFPRRILSENLYYSVFLWSMYFVWKKPFKKTEGLLWDVFTGALLGLLYLTRYISLIVIPMLLIAWWVKPFDENDRLFKPSWKKILRFLLIVLVAVLVFCPWIVSAVREGVPVKMALGFVITADTTQQQLSFSNFLVWLVLYTGYIVVMLSPFLPFLLESIALLDFAKWREEFGRWIFQTLVVTAGFLAAATRHSWRAIYNHAIPQILMGRYVLFIAVPFLVLSFFAMDLYAKKAARSSLKKDIWLLVISGGLVLLSYFIIVDPKIIQVEPYFARIETSADAYYVGILGIAYFVLIAVLYGLYWFFFKSEKKRSLVFNLITAVLAVFFIGGWFEYSDQLLAKQTNSWLSSEVAGFVRESVPASELEGEELSLFIPESFGNKEKIELYNGLRVRGFDNTGFYVFDPVNITGMPTNYGVTIRECSAEEIPDDSTDVYYVFNNACYTFGSLGFSGIR